MLGIPLLACGLALEHHQTRVTPTAAHTAAFRAARGGAAEPTAAAAAAATLPSVSKGAEGTVEVA